MRAEFAAGARNAVRACLNIGGQDRVCIIRDHARAEIADAIAEEALGTGATVRVWTMEDHTQRPAPGFPAALADDITKSIADRRAQARAIHDWVSKNVRYFAIFLGQGGYVPHSAASVIALDTSTPRPAQMSTCSTGRRARSSRLFMATNRNARDCQLEPRCRR